ncbi:hypothetical protein SAMN06269185_0689 [Natronoarchaeum philippinense]|uniref:PRC-barrel domain-containing protein n=1 Tax=Natronoarchaeum philippinense TaxID=558529 RepID=A0A285N5Y4_NATPI|nr:DUF2171 domain-containing protein [Natronoarchaeum philippinense]SNZ04820.1 hypothetical protein SAMN06269185_0689 [Natronoarchaeum philippinense]
MNDDTRTQPTTDDEGKAVIDASGEHIGEVSELRGETIVVDAKSSITDQIKSVLGWGQTDDAYRIDRSQIDRITDEAVHVHTTEGSGEQSDDRMGSGGRTVEDERTEHDETGREGDAASHDTAETGARPMESDERRDEPASRDDRDADDDREGLTDDELRDREEDDREGLTDDELRDAGDDDREERR